MVKLRPCRYPLKTQNRSANTKVKNGVGFPSRIRRGKMSALYQTKKRKFIVLTTKKEIVLKSKHCPHYPTFEILSTSPWCLFERISALALTPKTLIFFLPNWNHKISPLSPYGRNFELCIQSNYFGERSKGN